MPAQCIAEQVMSEGFDGRRLVAAFDGGAVTADARALLLRGTGQAIGLVSAGSRSASGGDAIPAG